MKFRKYAYCIILILLLSCCCGNGNNNGCGNYVSNCGC